MHRPLTSLERVLAIAVAGLLGAVVLAAATSSAGPRTTGRAHAAEATMVTLVNAERAQHGLAALAAHDDLSEVAHAWSVAMAAGDDLAHNPDHPAQICCWSAVSENVAVSDPHRLWHPGDPVDRIMRELHQALLDSPGHRANLLDAQVDEIGIGIEVDHEGRVWITQNLRRRAGP